MRFIYFKILVCFLFVFVTVNAQPRTLSPQASVSLLTCDSGNELYSLFGHTAIRVYDPENMIDTVYNYGAFDFSTPNFYLKFVKGDLQYFISTSTYEEFLAEYRYFQRGVFEQKLNLTQEQKQKIADDLARSLYSEDRYYTYKFIDRNCTTKVVDVVQKHISNKLSMKIPDAGKTYRTILYGYLNRHHFYENLGINILFGIKTDEVLSNVFLPSQFMESVAHSQNGTQDLTNSTEIVVNKNTFEAPMSLWNNIYTFIGLLVIIVLLNRKWLTVTLFKVMGSLGLFLMVAGWYSFHEELQWNYNVLLFNPVLLATAFFIWKGNANGILKTIYFNLGALAVYIIVLANKAHFVMFLPMIIANAVLMGRLVLKYRKAVEAEVGLKFKV